MTRNPVSVPIAPLEDRMRAYFGPFAPLGGGPGHAHARNEGYTAERAADALGISPRTWFRYLARGQITVLTADRLAHRIGCHPSEIWEDWYALTAGRSRRRAHAA